MNDIEFGVFLDPGRSRVAELFDATAAAESADQIDAFGRLVIPRVRSDR